MAKKKLSKEERLRRNKRIRRQITGGIFFAFALVGVVAVVSLAVQGIKGLFSTEDQQKKLESRIEYVVALDPVPFDITTNPDNNTLLEAAIYKAISGYPEESRSFDDEGRLILPDFEVTKAAGELYPSVFRLTHASFADANGNVEFTYDSEKKCYYLPNTTLSGAPYPIVVAMTREGDNLVLSVAYMSPGTDTFFTGIRNPERDRLIKYMEYVMVSEDGEWQLHTVRRPILPATPSL